MGTLVASVLFSCLNVTGLYWQGFDLLRTIDVALNFRPFSPFFRYVSFRCHELLKNAFDVITRSPLDATESKNKKPCTVFSIERLNDQ